LLLRGGTSGEQALSEGLFLHHFPPLDSKILLLVGSWRLSLGKINLPWVSFDVLPLVEQLLSLESIDEPSLVQFKVLALVFDDLLRHYALAVMSGSVFLLALSVAAEVATCLADARVFFFLEGGNIRHWYSFRS